MKIIITHNRGDIAVDELAYRVAISLAADADSTVEACQAFCNFLGITMTPADFVRQVKSSTNVPCGFYPCADCGTLLHWDGKVDRDLCSRCEPCQVT